MYDNFKWRINFWSNGDVVTNDGEIIGSQEGSSEDHPSFTPTGADKPLIYSMFIPELAKYVAEWLEEEPIGNSEIASGK